LRERESVIEQQQQLLSIYSEQEKDSQKMISFLSLFSHPLVAGAKGIFWDGERKKLKAERLLSCV
jgi:hypothetical protein